MSLPEPGTQPAERVGASPREIVAQAQRTLAAQPSPARDDAARDVARYVGSLAGEMATMARREGMTTLAHLLDMSRLEARELERRAALRG